MTENAVKASGLSKAYRLGGRADQGDTLVEAIAALAAAPLHKLRSLRRLDTLATDRDTDDILWALKDVSFEIKEGETLGIVGRNGAGKSTLLKILSRITHPTTGSAEIHGRVSSLLEVGTGFHPELTGRENVYLNGTILGMKRKEIAGKFDEIVDFSGVERFLDTPVKRYSSGMKVRLAFSVAAHLEPEILIVDEVLAVGDAEFQAKCLGKMQGVAASGRTVLFVSHNMGAVQKLCSRALALSAGRLVDNGPPADVVGRYLAQMHHTQEDAFSLVSPERTNTGIFRFVSGKVTDRQGRTTANVISGEPIALHLAYTADRDLTGVTFRITVSDETGTAVTTLSTRLTGFKLTSTGKRGTVICTLPKNPFALGEYRVEIVARRQGQLIDHIPAALKFSVTDSVFFDTTKTPKRGRSVFYADHDWSVESEIDDELDGRSTA